MACKFSKSQTRVNQQLIWASCTIYVGKLPWTVESRNKHVKRITDYRYNLKRNRKEQQSEHHSNIFLLTSIAVQEESQTCLNTATTCSITNDILTDLQLSTTSYTIGIDQKVNCVLHYYNNPAEYPSRLPSLVSVSNTNF
ncbi:hypothetical protein CU097_006638 [Rhizopus azygosporus]|uniref:Uncharacterized protein n=1 Tax=Rhizopus azygosporus TaxID=86630 RepID=A0A367J049_RHIAZ|nr:hypothetical protein CU097_006638 [Rhizopus azygosporus]